MQVTPAAARARTSARFVAIYALAYAALWLALLTPAIITLALRVRQLAPDNAAEPISRVLMAGAIVALVSNPVFGALSDSTRSRFGRRRPWLVGGVLCGCASLAVIGLAPTVNVVLLGWCAAQLSFNAVLAAMVAIIPDRVPPAQRGTVVGILGVCMPIGQITGTYLVQLLSVNMLMALLVPGAVGVAGVLALVYALGREPRVAGPGLAMAAELGGPAQLDAAVASAEFAVLGAAGKPASPESTAALGQLATPERTAAPGHLAPAGGPARPEESVATPGRGGSRRDFGWAWLSRVFFTTGSCFLQAYQPFFLLDALHMSPADVPHLMFRSTLVQAAMVVIWSLISGRLSDRTGLRKPFVMAGSTLQGLGLWVIAFSHSYSMLLLGVGLVGMGHGVYEGVDLALVTDVLPDRARHAAKDLGLLNIANTLPQVIAPLAAPVILAISRGDYLLLFAVAGAVAVLGSVFLLPLKNVR
ncbi:MAG TPA: MFS transporter [Steroidobacteraceae bacterium]